MQNSSWSSSGKSTKIKLRFGVSQRSKPQNDILVVAFLVQRVVATANLPRQAWICSRPQSQAPFCRCCKSQGVLLGLPFELYLLTSEGVQMNHLDLKASRNLLCVWWNPSNPAKKNIATCYIQHNRDVAGPTYSSSRFSRKSFSEVTVAGLAKIPQGRLTQAAAARHPSGTVSN